MKKILLFLMLLSATSAFAQDVIVKKDGSTIVSKVIEITSTEVKYKKFSNLNGPMYTIAKTELLSINYENGEKETFGTNTTSTFTIESITNQNLAQVNDETLLRLAKGDPDNSRAKRFRIIGWIGGPIFVAAGSVLMGIGIAWDLEDDGLGPFLGGVGCVVAGITWTSSFLVAAKRAQREAYVLQIAPLLQKEFSFTNGSSLLTGIDILRDNIRKNSTIGLGLRYNF